jgi:kelch-like protein 10
MSCPQQHPLVKDNAACKPLIIETLKFIWDLDMEEGSGGAEAGALSRPSDMSNHPLARPRVPHELMFVVGGWSGGSPTSVIEAYDTRADKWISVEIDDVNNPNQKTCK